MSHLGKRRLEQLKRRLSSTHNIHSPMSDTDILSQLTTVFRRVFENSALEIHTTDTAEDIPGWDSMAQVTLAVEIENYFSVKIKSAEMETIRNIQDLIAMIKDRLPATAT